jgi:toxin ParE1/3/4
MPFRIHVSNQARRDIAEALAWTRDRFGEDKEEEYWDLILAAFADLARDPEKARRRPELHPQARTFHIARRGKRARHFLLLSIAEPDTVEIARLLHDSMDLASHLPQGYEA